MSLTHSSMFDAAALRSVPSPAVRRGQQQCTGQRGLRRRGVDAGPGWPGPHPIVLNPRDGHSFAGLPAVADGDSLALASGGPGSPCSRSSGSSAKRLGPPGQVLGQLLLGAHTTRRTARRTISLFPALSRPLGRSLDLECVQLGLVRAEGWGKKEAPIFGHG